MADEKSPFPGASGPSERRRPAPTIDLKATEVASDPPPGSAPLREAAEQQEPPPQESASASASAAARRAEFVRRSRAFWPVIGAGIAGAVLTLAIVGLVWLATGRDDQTAIEARIAKLERELADLAKQPASPNPDLVARLQKLETQVGTLAAAPARPGDPGLAGRVTTIDGEIRSLRDMTEALSGRTQDIAAGVADARRRADANAAALAELAQKPAPPTSPAADSGDTSAMLSALMDRVAALEARPSGADDHAARTALVAATLAAAVERGASFTAELKAAQTAGGKALAPLEPFAASGLPSPNALARELAGLEPELLAATEPPRASGGYLEKLKANAGKLFDVQPVDQAPAGDEPGAIVVRAEFKASHGDFDGALTDLGKLPAPARAMAQPWIEKAQARMAALAASRKFAADALAALGGP
jgi:hypothetical protein